ncbi:uncharacterized protein CCOS01_15401 [Colletotrichum costaricense]|uniref:Uncharacterized protein n=1 Tax=Colletotrichum costaricense TaxID=1209916 RepID=A0AAI9YHX1_9PEZI|nr:uncharacterized protein CCOS01_15401 [Colletotrichum costaricense]KAK1510570.1 hypothetical protein CCOS01_15401 [Colletotrichum costaricense]
MRLCNHTPTGLSHPESWFYCSPLPNGNTLRHVFQIAGIICSSCLSAFPAPPISLPTHLPYGIGMPVQSRRTIR